ncbi:MAG: RnfABCDGE type electron transport complex subunit B [Gammaproteobacteria bacterium]|nr:RnfABCDGE type electron transport complex subunit B [Gammaproteobacteria bacterium]
MKFLNSPWKYPLILCFSRREKESNRLNTGKADINQCPPGGETTLQALAELLHTERKPLDPRFGKHTSRARAVIDEKICIGCRKCIDVCPVDAIMGARKWMHSVIAAECTGCELCLPPCPVDCIVMQPLDIAANDPWPEYARAETEHWRRRTERRLERLQQPTREPRGRTMNKQASAGETYATFPKDKEKIRADIREAVARSQNKKLNIKK